MPTDPNTTNGWSLEGAKVNGREVAIGTSFRDAVTAAAQAAHYNNFRVFVNGVETGVANAPQTVAAGMNIEVRPHDKAGA